MGKRLRGKNQKTRRDVATRQKTKAPIKRNKSSVAASRKGRKRISNAMS